MIYLKSTEIYDPKTGKFTMGPDMAQARFRHQAFLLPDGSVMLIGGKTYPLSPRNKYDTIANSAVEIYNPIDNKFEKNSNLEVSDKIYRIMYSTQFQNGKILITYTGNSRMHIKLYNPETSEFELDKNLPWNKDFYLFTLHSPIYFENNQLLYPENINENTAELSLYDFDKQKIKKGPRRNFLTINSRLVNIGNNNILVIGGTNDPKYAILLDAEVCNIKKNKCIPVKSKLKESCSATLLTKMDSDNILIFKVGYYDKLNSLVEKYSIKENDFYNNNIRIPQHFSQAIKLKDGEILCLGGRSLVPSLENLKNPIATVGLGITISLLTQSLVNPLLNNTIVKDCYIYKY